MFILVILEKSFSHQCFFNTLFDNRNILGKFIKKINEMLLKSIREKRIFSIIDFFNV
jgi:hypothetical protein